MTLRRTIGIGFERVKFPDSPDPVPHLVLQVITRTECDCAATIGRRMDKNEPTFSLYPCPQHAEAARRAHARFVAAPPSPVDAAELYEAFLVEELRHAAH